MERLFTIDFMGLYGYLRKKFLHEFGCILFCVIFSWNVFIQKFNQMRITKNRNRPLDKVNIGVEIAGPAPDFAKLADSMGCLGIGPIEDPEEIHGALTKALQVKSERSLALEDIITEPH
jgi:thiamine pyrophosphate-dependent acetolactate synthase large subunit-like protein